MKSCSVCIGPSLAVVRVALHHGPGAVQEFHVERTLERGLVGNIYLGKVSRVLPVCRGCAGTAPRWCRRTGWALRAGRDAAADPRRPAAWP
ncbi:MAG: hypothetical protein ACKOD9_01625, partial [Rubrivivax sp.]